ncbi:beta-ketoacyl synthase N-terminal-like domain-containing protein [Umezawaea endophytica]|uniref:3-oxoacyl-ACP synthase n=1 Tax=Umezawaea endophytica TaxID=1654476 RepID=A0A9X3AIV1_9PSEU|nr:beta-ketoacyl synthase N-terminal-like domain-containing protein [Umezawaea endophytica]MCS7483572.1 3-oxoacyl-ACP synthase [Umezawaea endophytica]
MTTEPRLVITAWSAVSPYGIGRESFVDGIASSTSTVTELDQDLWQGPTSRGCLVPGFDIREVLGAKGTRKMDRVTALVVSTVGQLLADGGISTGEDTALVLGSTMGSAQSIMDFTKDVLVRELPYLVDPAKMPNSVMNCAAGACAIWHGLKGPNTTLAGGQAAGLMALDYARRLLIHDRAAKVLVGAAEEYSTERAWLDRHSWPAETPDRVLGEGCAVLLVETADQAALTGGRTPLAEVLATESRVYLEGDPTKVLIACVQSVLARAGVRADEVWAAVPSSVGDRGRLESGVVRSLFGAEVVDRVPTGDVLGDTGAASAALRIAAVLSVAEHSPEAAGRVALVTSADRYGTVACSLLRLADPASS